MIDRPIDKLGFNQWQGKYSQQLRAAAAEAANNTGQFYLFCQKAWESQRELENKLAQEALSS